jgi:hypothetical protein
MKMPAQHGIVIIAVPALAILAAPPWPTRPMGEQDAAMIHVQTGRAVPQHGIALIAVYIRAGCLVHTTAVIQDAQATLYQEPATNRARQAE